MKRNEHFISSLSNEQPVFKEFLNYQGEIICLKEAFHLISFPNHKLITVAGLIIFFTGRRWKVVHDFSLIQAFCVRITWKISRIKAGFSLLIFLEQ